MAPYGYNAFDPLKPWQPPPRIPLAMGPTPPGAGPPPALPPTMRDLGWGDIGQGILGAMGRGMPPANSLSQALGNIGGALMAAPGHALRQRRDAFFDEQELKERAEEERRRARAEQRQADSDARQVESHEARMKDRQRGLDEIAADRTRARSEAEKYRERQGDVGGAGMPLSPRQEDTAGLIEQGDTTLYEVGERDRSEAEAAQEERERDADLTQKEAEERRRRRLASQPPETYVKDGFVMATMRRADGTPYTQILGKAKADGTPEETVDTPFVRSRTIAAQEAAEKDASLMVINAMPDEERTELFKLAENLGVKPVDAVRNLPGYGDQWVGHYESLVEQHKRRLGVQQQAKLESLRASDVLGMGGAPVTGGTALGTAGLKQAESWGNAPKAKKLRKLESIAAGVVTEMVRDAGQDPSKVENLDEVVSMAQKIEEDVRRERGEAPEEAIEAEIRRRLRAEIEM